MRSTLDHNQETGSTKNHTRRIRTNQCESQSTRLEQHGAEDTRRRRIADRGCLHWSLFKNVLTWTTQQWGSFYSQPVLLLGELQERGNDDSLWPGWAVRVCRNTTTGIYSSLYMYMDTIMQGLVRGGG